MRYYLEALYKSFSSPSWLASQSRSTGKAGKFFVILMFILSLGFGLNIIYREIPQVVPVLQKTLTSDIPDFAARFEGGTLTVSELTQPFVYHARDDRQQDFVFVIDTVSTGTVSLAPYLTSTTTAGLLISRTGIMTSNLGDAAATEQKFGEIPNVSFSKAQILSFVDRILHDLRPGLLALLVAFTFALWGIGLILFVLLFASITYLIYISVTKQEKLHRYTWKEVFTISLFSLALPKLIIFVLNVTLVTSLPYAVVIAMAIAVSRALRVPRSSEHQNDSEIVDEG